MAGRPTKYKEIYVKMMNKFFNFEPYHQINEYNKAKKLKNIRLIANPFPTLSAFATSIGVDGDTLVEWSKPKNELKYPGFSAAYKRAKSCQIHLLIQNGLMGLYKPAFAMFVCKNLLDTRKRQEAVNDYEVKTPIDFTYVMPKQ